MAVVGEATVEIRAIGDKVNADVSRILRSAAPTASREADEIGNDVGAQFGESFTEGAEGSIDDSGFGERIGGRVRNQLNAPMKRAGDDSGNSFATSLIASVLRGISGLGGAVASIAGSFALITAVGGGIGALVGAVGALAAGLVSLVGPASVAATAIGVVGASLVGALGQGVIVGLGFISLFKGDLETLPPIAQQVAGQLRDLQSRFRELYTSLADGDGPLGAFSALLDTVGGSLFPVLEKGIASTGEAIAAVIGDFNDLASSTLFQQDLAQVMDTNADSIESLGGGFVDLTGALFSVLAAADPLIDRFTTWFSEWASYIADTAQLGQETGRLTAFFDRAGDVAATLFSALSDVGGILYDIGQAAGPLGTLLLGNFGRAASALNAFLDTDAGRSALADFFAPDGPMATNLASIGNLAKELGKSFVSLTQNRGIAQIGDALTAVLPGVTDVVNTLILSLGNVAEAIGTAFTSAAGQAGLVALQTGIRDLSGAFANLAPAIGPLLTIIGNLATTVANVLGPAFSLISDIMPRLIGPVDQLADAFGTFLLAAIEALLPLLPQLVQIAADIASAFAGPLSSSIQVSADAIGVIFDAISALMPVISALAPAITAVVVGFGAFSAIRNLTGVVSGFATSLATAAAAGGPFAGALDKASSSASRVAGALPGIGIALTGLVIGYEAYRAAVAEADRQEQELGQALLQGGSAADTAQAQVERLKVTHDALADALANAAGASTGLGGILASTGIFDSTVASGEDAVRVAEEYTASLTPLEAAQQAVTAATNDYATAINNGDTEGAAAAQDRLTAAQAEAERQQRILDDATQSYSDSLRDSVSAIYEAQNAELGRSNAQIGASQALLSVESAQIRYNEAVAEYGPESLQARQASLDLASAQNNVVAQASAAATAIGEGVLANGRFSSETEGANASVQAQIEYLQGLADQATGPTREALLDLISNLESVPLETQSKVDVATADAEARMKDVNDGLDGLDRRVDRPTVDLESNPAKQKLIEVERALAEAATKKYKAELGANAEPANTEISKFQAGLRKLEEQRATAILDADSVAGQTRLNEINARIEDYRRSEASATLTADGTFAGATIEGVQVQLDGLNDYEAIAKIKADNTEVVTKTIDANARLQVVAKQITIPRIGADDTELVGKTISVGAALTGIATRITIPKIGANDTEAQNRMADVKAKMAAIAAQNTTPRINTNDSDAQGKMADVRSKLAQLNSTVSTPRTGLNDGSSGAIAGINGSLANLGRINVNPSVSVRDGASGTLSSIRNQIDNIKDKTVTITTKAVTLKSGVAAGGGRINTDQFTTVGEEGRELVFLSQGSYVATAAQTNRILQAARLQSEGALLDANAARTITASSGGGTGGGVNIPISVVTQRGQSNTEIASETARQLAFKYRRTS